MVHEIYYVPGSVLWLEILGEERGVVVRIAGRSGDDHFSHSVREPVERLTVSPLIQPGHARIHLFIRGGLGILHPPIQMRLLVVGPEGDPSFVRLPPLHRQLGGMLVWTLDLRWADGLLTIEHGDPVAAHRSYELLFRESVPGYGAVPEDEWEYEFQLSTPEGAISPDPAPQRPKQGAQDALPNGSYYRAWYATNRVPVYRGNRLVGFGRRGHAEVTHGACDVFIPTSHLVGSLGSGWLRRLVRRTDDRLKLVELFPLEAEAYWAEIRAYAAEFAPEERHALVFLHGYNVSFKAAALRAAQLGNDLNIPGPVAFFSWPSRGTLLGYAADGAAIEASEEAITQFLLDFARNSGVGRVHIIAHSMGNRGLLRAMQRILSRAEAESPVRFGHLVLAAPDVTRELFLPLAKQYGRLAERTTLYISSRDRALAASRFLQGDRVGFAPPVTVCPEIDTIYVANVDDTFMGHSPFAEARPVLTDIHNLFRFDARPEQRLGLKETFEGEMRYWVMRP